MKNTHIQNLDEIIPKDIRVQTYIDALEYIEIEENRNKWGEGLCLVLPCIMWGLRSYLSNAPDGQYWDWTDTQKVFPELGRDIGKIYEALHKENIIRIRMKLLRNWIKELSDD